jgi:CHAD domain-containing protein
MHTHLQKYFDQRVKNLFNYLHDFDLNRDDVSLHEFRVEMKKLRSVIKFLKEIYPKQKLKKPAHALSNIFHAAGEIRQYQLLQQWFWKNRFFVIENSYFPQNELQLLINNFHERLPEYKTDLKKVVTEVEKFIRRTSEILSKQYLIKLQTQLNKLCQKDLPVNNWHELRKTIKQWMYATNWMQQVEENNNDTFSYYNKLQEIIGEWHDFILLKDAISQKQIYLSQNLEVQKELAPAWKKLSSAIKRKEKQIEKMLALTLAEK